MTEDREQELREEAEKGRRRKIALEELRGFMDSMRENLIRKIEADGYSYDDEQLQDIVSDLRAIKRFREACEMKIAMGEIAEEELSNGE